MPLPFRVALPPQQVCSLGDCTRAESRHEATTPVMKEYIPAGRSQARLLGHNELACCGQSEDAAKSALSFDDKLCVVGPDPQLLYTLHPGNVTP